MTVAMVTPTWDFADRLRKVRITYTTMTMEQMAQALGVGAPRYKAWEAGRNMPRPALLIEMAIKLQELTGVSADWTISG